MEETKRNFIDYLIDKREYYKEQIEYCRLQMDCVEHNSLDYKSYKWQVCDYEARLDAINDLLGSIRAED